VSAILARRTKEPTICFVCQGEASGIGVCRRDRKGYATPPFDGWTCASCAKVARDLIQMTPKDIGLIEQKACESAAKATLDKALAVYMGALWDAGVRDLGAATDDQVSLAKDALVVNGAAGDFVREVVLAFGDDVKAAVERQDPPF